MHAFIFKESDILGLASKVISTFHEYKIFTLEGDLGAGKTTFVKALCGALESIDDISSPTFSLVNEYETKSSSRIYHMDLYRVEDESELLNIGFEDYLHTGAYCFIEWPAIGKAYLDNHIHIQIDILSNDYRKFTFSKK